MNPDLWTKVDDFFANGLLADDGVLTDTVAANRNAGLPAIDVSPLQGKLLYLLAKMQAAKTILEIGTLGGYSTIWLARALPPDGRLVTLEMEPKHALVAQQNIERAQLTPQVNIVVGPALESLPKIKAEKGGPFDLIFIDADKPNTWSYFQFALELARSGTLIIADNVVRKGEIIDATSQDPSVQGMRLFTERLAQEARVEATAIQTVGAKGYDGFILARVK